MSWRLQAAGALLLALDLGAQQPPTVTITFLANEGVKVAAGDRAVLIDGLFRYYGDDFALPHDSTQRALEAASTPFHDVDVVLVTHRHGDHFHPAAVAAHMRANARAVLVTSPQVIDSLHAGASSVSRFAGRVHARAIARGERRREVVNGVPIELLGLPHGGGRRNAGVQNISYIVELGGRRVLHLGDVDTSEEHFRRMRLDTARVDVALVPAWMITDDDGRRTLERWIRPRQVVAIHAPAKNAAGTARAVRQAMPRAYTFVRSLDSLRW